MAISKIRGSQILSLTLDDSHVAAGAAIATSKLADGALLIKSDGSVPYISAISGVDPTLSTHLATKNYVDSVASGADPKASCRAATVGNIVLSGLQTVDGVALAVGNRVLVKNQSTGANNGIYIASTSAWTRALDADANAEVTSGLFTFIEEGTALAATGWILVTTGAIVVGTTALTFTQFSGAGTYTASNGMTLTGNQFNVVSGNGGIVSSAGSLSLTLADATLAIVAGGVKLAPLASAQILVGNGSSVATARAMSGAVTMDNTGITALGAGVVGTTQLAAGAVTAAKHEVMTPGQIMIGKAAGNGYVALSGDATMTEAGVVTVGAAMLRATNFVTRETPAGTQNGVNLVFTLAFAPVAGTETVMFNGQVLDPGAGNDYTISGQTITLLAGWAPNGTTDKLRVSYIK